MLDTSSANVTDIIEQLVDALDALDAQSAGRPPTNRGGRSAVGWAHPTALRQSSLGVVSGAI
ncbi:hypothetical protein GCM10009776_26030 [Microbacterium deminutum]|uniref:Uncharacterized protein n=2 Tax=Microbacterium deminutum TaxID=344164 RepID=A0ABP5CDA8_9MICO